MAHHAIRWRNSHGLIKRAYECRRFADHNSTLKPGAKKRRRCLPLALSRPRAMFGAVVLRAVVRSREDSPCEHTRADAAASTASLPHVRDDARPPLAGPGRRRTGSADFARQVN